MCAARFLLLAFPHIQLEFTHGLHRTLEYSDGQFFTSSTYSVLRLHQRSEYVEDLKDCPSEYSRVRCNPSVNANWMWGNANRKKRDTNAYEVTGK